MLHIALTNFVGLLQRIINLCFVESLQILIAKFFKRCFKYAMGYIIRTCETLDQKIDKFIEALSLLIERHAPLQQQRVSHKYCLWLSSDFYQLGKTRDKLKKAAIKSKSNYLMTLYRHVRNKVNSLIRG